MSSRAAAGRKRLQNGPPPPKPPSKPSKFARAFSKSARVVQETPPPLPTPLPVRHIQTPVPENTAPATSNVLLYSPQSNTLKPYTSPYDATFPTSVIRSSPQPFQTENRPATPLGLQSAIYRPPPRPFAYSSNRSDISSSRPGTATGRASPALTATSISIANFPLNSPSLHSLHSDDLARQRRPSNTPMDIAPIIGQTNALHLSASNRQAVFYPSPPRSPANAQIMQELGSPSVSATSLHVQNSPMRSSSSEPSLLDSPYVSVSPATRPLDHRPMSTSSTSPVTPKRPDGFYFPSSRSRAVPAKKDSANPPNALSFKFKKKSSPLAPGMSPPPSARSDGSFNSIGTPSLDRVISQGSLGTRSVDQQLRRQFSPSAPSVASSSSGSVGTPQGQFVFPSSRSRAHPKPRKSPTLAESGSDGDWRKPREKFMGLRFKKKQRTKKGKTGYAEGAPASLRPASIIMEEGPPAGDEAATPILQQEFQQGSSRNPTPGGQIWDTANKSYDVRPESALLEGQDIRLPYLATPTPEPILPPRKMVEPISRVGTYPLDSYDSALIENDRLTYELLKQTIQSKTPCFFQYGNDPPSKILDLGCGQGSWLLDAALEWKGFGTKVTGVDIVDISRSLRGRAAKLGVSENIEFIRTNFIKQDLPFPDETFDLVRMSCLALAVPYEKWDHILREASRVLTLGGRLELIDDHIFFAYGKSSITPAVIPSSDPTSQPTESLHAPALTVNFPSPNLSVTSSPAPSTQTMNPAAEDAELYGMYQDDYSESATLLDTPDMAPRWQQLPANSPSSGASANRLRIRPLSSQMSMDSEGVSWAEAVASSREMELLFEHMMNMRYGIHLCPSEFILPKMQQVFGHAKEVETLHFTLASSEEPSGGTAGDEEANPLTQAPGLILWPSTLLKMSRTEVEAHALKHNKVLLSCKAALSEYASEFADGEEIEEEAMMEALWDYESFLTDRFAPPPGVNVDLFPTSSSRPASPPTILSGHKPSDSLSPPPSMLSLSDDGHRAMREYQEELQTHFAWPPNRGVPEPQRPRASEPTGYLSPSMSPQPPPFGLSPRSGRAASAPLPGYSRFEPTHVRTFHIFDAIKLDQSLFGTQD